MRELLKLPDTHRIGIVPGSDTGAFEMAMWTMLGARPVTTRAGESCGEGWVTDAVKQLKLDPTVLRADYGQIADLNAVDWSNDVLFTWNGTTSGVRVPNGDWIADDREGLSFADATSAVFAYDLPWDKIDVATFSWQKVLGGEGAHGVLILGPRAVESLETYTPAWPLPKVFRLVSKGKLAEGVVIVAPFKTPTASLPVDTRRDTLGSGPAGVEGSRRTTARGAQHRSPCAPSPAPHPPDRRGVRHVDRPCRGRPRRRRDARRPGNARPSGRRRRGPGRKRRRDRG